MLDSAGAEVGDQNHSKAFPPRVVDEGYKLLCEQLKGYFTNIYLSFAILADHRQRSGQTEEEHTRCDPTAEHGH